MPEMHEIGEKSEEMKAIASEEPVSTPEKIAKLIKPEIRFLVEQVPEIADKEVGTPVRFVCDGEIKGIREKQPGKEEEIEVTVEISKLGLLKADEELKEKDEDEEGRPVKTAVKEAQEELTEKEEGGK